MYRYTPKLILTNSGAGPIREEQDWAYPPMYPRHRDWFRGWLYPYQLRRSAYLRRK